MTTWQTITSKMTTEMNHTLRHSLTQYSINISTNIQLQRSVPPAAHQSLMNIPLCSKDKQQYSLSLRTHTSTPFTLHKPLSHSNLNEQHLLFEGFLLDQWNISLTMRLKRISRARTRELSMVVTFTGLLVYVWTAFVRVGQSCGLPILSIRQGT